MSEDPRLDLDDDAASGGPVECLGVTFESDEARREHYLAILREKLKDPEFRKIEGFPIGEDEDILSLSDPPYYTACPNPFIEEFIRHYGKPYDPKTDDYHREPFAADVSEGKSDPLYTAHSYPTKVPHKAIMRYALHYTEPGDLILDGFCGTGMTGVAAQLCGDKATVESLGFAVEPDGTVLDDQNRPLSRLGARRALLVDLSPTATFIAYNQCTPPALDPYQHAVERVLVEAESADGWMQRTVDASGHAGTIYHTVWSEVLVCTACSQEMTFWEAAVDPQTSSIGDVLRCPHCRAVSAKRELTRAASAELRATSNEVVARAKYTPVGIRELERGSRRERPLTTVDLDTIRKVEAETIPYWYPTASIERDIDMWYERDYRSLGIYTVDAFYTKRNLWLFSGLWHRALAWPSPRIRSALLFTLSGMAVNLSRMNRWRPNVSFPYNPISGTLYVPALPVESNVFHGVRNKAARLARIWSGLHLPMQAFVSTQSSTNLRAVPPASVDYIFTDPPFGSNIIYSDLSVLQDAWLRIQTNTTQEAVVHRRKVERRSLSGYKGLMAACLSECRRALKPSRWLTMVFHNSQNAVWVAIQEALQEAGFVVGDVRMLDKQQGSFKQVTAAGAVKQDLVISAYKPNGGLEDRFRLEAGTEDGVWDFMRTHLRQLPVFVASHGQAEVIAERQDYLLFDRMVAFHVQRGVTIPLSAAEFYGGLRERFPERDGMFFLPDQVTEYDRKRLSVSEVLQLQLFVTDESSAIQWLRQQLTKKPQTFQELQPQFMRELAGWQKHEKTLELSELLEENFLCYEGEGEVPSQIHGHLSSDYHDLRSLEKGDPALIAKALNRWYVPDPNKEADLEKIRHRALMREFRSYQETKGKLKVLRTEALRAGFKELWGAGDYAGIVSVAERVPNAVIQEDPALLMYYDNALMRTEA